MVSRYESLEKHLWVFPLALSILFFPINGVYTSPDASWYISNALNIYKGYGYVDPDLSPVLNRGPVFSTLIAISFWIFGVSVKHALWVVRFFYILNTVLIYFIGYKFYNKFTGLTASLLVLTSYTINRWSSVILLDIVMPFFILLLIFLLQIAFQKENYIYFILSGLVLGTAYLTKESSFLFIPLPFLIFFISKKFRTKKILIGLLFYILSASTVVLPWIYYVYDRSNDLSLLIGGGGPKVAKFITDSTTGDSITTTTIKKIYRYYKFFSNYYYKYFHEPIILSPIFLLSWIFLVFKSIYLKKSSDLLLIFSLLLFSPLCFYLGAKELREGQNIFLYFLSFLVFSHFVVFVINFFSNKSYDLFLKGKKNNIFLTASVTGTLILCIIGLQIFGDDKMLTILKGNGNRGFNYYSNNNFNTSGWHNDKVKKAGAWITKNVDKNSNIMSDWHYLRSLYYYTDGNYRIHKIPYRVSIQKNTMLMHTDITSTSKCKLLFLLPNNNESNYENYLRAFCEDDLLNDLKEKKIKYVVITQGRSFLSIYFEKNPVFKKLLDLDKIIIYEVEEIEGVKNFNTRIGSRLAEYINNVREVSQEKYIAIYNNYFVEILNLNEEEIAKISNGSYQTIDPN